MSRPMTGISAKTLVLQSVQVAFVSWRISGGIASEAMSGIVAKRSTIGLRPLVSFGRPFGTTLRSTVCASELVLFLHSFLSRLEARNPFQFQIMTKNGWTRLGRFLAVHFWREVTNRLFVAGSWATPNLLRCALRTKR